MEPFDGPKTPDVPVSRIGVAGAVGVSQLTKRIHHNRGPQLIPILIRHGTLGAKMVVMIPHEIRVVARIDPQSGGDTARYTRLAYVI